MAKRWLQRKFTEFLVEMERQKEAVRSARWAYRDDAPAGPGGLAGHGPNPVWESLANMLRRQAAEARESGTSGANLYREAQYAMVALADQTFIVDVPDWPGQDAWRNHSLEMEFFQSAVAGEELFGKMEELLARRDPSERDLADVYFYVLALGFQGKYFAADARPGARVNPKIAELRSLLSNAFSGDRNENGHGISPRAYAHIRPGSSTNLLPTLTQSIAFLLIAILLLSVTKIGLDALQDREISGRSSAILERAIAELK